MTILVRACFLRVLTPRQINERKLSAGLLSGEPVGSIDDDGEDEVGSAALIIHQSLPYLSSAKTSLEDVVGIFLASERLDDNILDLNLSGLVHLNIKLWSVLLALWHQKITKFTFIDFHHVAGEINLEVRFHLSNDLIELVD